MQTFLRTLAALGTGAAGAALAYLLTALGALDPAQLVSEPWQAGILAAVIAAAARAVNWAIAKLPREA